MRLGFEEPFLHRLLPVLSSVMGGVYGELSEAETASRGTVRSEEEKFLATVATASRQVQESVDRVRAEGGDRLPGEAVFRLYDTYGLPLEMIREIAEEEQFGLDIEGFEEALGEQRQRSRAAIGDSRHRLAQVREVLRGRATEFTGYDSLREEGVEVVALARARRGRRQPRRERLGRGDVGVVVLERTPFYGESGGQVGDRGRLEWPDGAAVVEDTQKEAAGTIFHFLRVERGELGRRRPGHRGGRRGAAARHPAQSHRHPPAAPGAAPPAGRRRAPGRLAGGAGPAALRLHLRATGGAGRAAP